MQGQYAQLLKTLITKLEQWRLDANSAGIKLQQVNTKFPDDSFIILSWENDIGQWIVETQGNPDAELKVVNPLG